LFRGVCIYSAGVMLLREDGERDQLIPFTRSLEIVSPNPPK